MSFFSKSKSKGYYPKHDHGHEYYKRPHHFGGIIGAIINVLTGARSHSHSDYHREHYSHRHGNKKSWS